MRSLAFLLLLPLCHAYEPTLEELKTTNQALAKWLTIAQESSRRPAEEAILELGRGIRKLVREDIYPSPMREETYKAVQQALMSIPDHAEYFGRKIRSDEALFASGRGHEVQGGALWDFETLGQLPSPETVKVLGSFLDDEKNRIDTLAPGADVAPIPANSLLSARALHSLKIVSPPLQNRPAGYEDVEPWRLWFAQLQAGTRTFRFKGDPQEYSLTGPVSGTRDPRIENRAPRSNEVRPPSLEPENKSANLPIWPLPIAGILLVLASWFAMKRKPAAS